MSVTIHSNTYTFTSGLDNAVDAYNSDDNTDGDIEIYSSDNLILIDCMYIDRDAEITFSDYPYEVTPYGRSTHCRVFSKTDKQYIAKDIIYAFTDDRVINAAFIYDEPLLTIASLYNNVPISIISATQIRINNVVYPDMQHVRVLFTKQPTFQNMFTQDYITTDESYYQSLANDTTLSQVIDLSKPSDNKIVLIDDNNQELLITPPNNHISFANDFQTLYTFIDNFVKTQQFKDCYNDLLNNTPFKKYFTQYINTFAVDIFNNESTGVFSNDSSSIPMYDSYIILANYTLSYIQNKFSAIDKDIFEQWINSNTCILNIINNVDLETLIGACVNYANRVFKHIVLSYIKSHKCADPADYILGFINSLPLMNDNSNNNTFATVNTANNIANTTVTTDTTVDNSKIIYIIIIIAVAVCIILIIVIISKNNQINSIKSNLNI